MGALPTLTPLLILLTPVLILLLMSRPQTICWLFVASAGVATPADGQERQRMRTEATAAR